MAREGLRAPLSIAVARAITEKQAVTYDRVHVKTNGDEACLKLTVRPLPDAAVEEGLLVVTFEELASEACALHLPASDPPNGDFADGRSGETAGEQTVRLVELERELRAAQEVSPGHDRRAGIDQRRAALGERRNAEHQRGIGDLA
jgi:hypothetical protein